MINAHHFQKLSNSSIYMHMGVDHGVHMFPLLFEVRGM